MTLTSRLVLYTAHVCPYAHRVEAALVQAGAKFEKVEIDLENKPEWYPAINPASKVPAIVVDKDNHAKDTTKIPETGVSINESLVLLELVADLFPDAHLLPHGLVNAVNRAKVRLFIEAGNYFNSAFFAWLFRRESSTGILQAIDALQAHLPQTGFLLGDNKPTIGDLALAPFFVRFKDFAENVKEDVVDAAGAKDLLETLKTEKYERFNRYIHDVLELPSVKTTSPSPQLTVEKFTKKLKTVREAAAAASNLLLLATAYSLPHNTTQPKPERSFKVELEEADLPLKLTEKLEQVNEFRFWGVKVYDKRSTTDPFDAEDPSMPRGWGTNHASASYHKNSEPLIIGISVVLASVIVFTMFGTIIWRRRRKSKARTKLKESEGGVDNEADPDEPRSTTTFMRKRRNPIKYLKHRKGRKLQAVPSLHSIVNPTPDDNDNDDERGELLSHNGDRQRSSEADDDSNGATGDIADNESNHSPPESSSHSQPPQVPLPPQTSQNQDNESPPPFTLDRDTDSGALPALPPAYRPNSNIPTASRQPTARQTEKSRYINSHGNNELLEEVDETPENDRVASTPPSASSDDGDENSAHHLTAHIAIDDKDHIRNLHLASSSPFQDDTRQRHHEEEQLNQPSVPAAHIDDDGYEAVEQGLWEQSSNQHHHDTKKRNDKAGEADSANAASHLPLPPTTFEPTFSPFDLPYSHQLDKDLPIPPTTPSAPPQAPSAPSAPSAPPMDNNHMEASASASASAPPLDSDDGHT
ncbi:hypothetical protein E3P99_00556 [Wallemia hederae]|uniref:GST N-terminal domain-containing protein n=1 Tax=Wallemia hederae TaxID=1540922 RepID=A0A4T0FW13_9BASI|nr:hypothetical protein E3P99_00556 [Wallemia hederae]